MCTQQSILIAVLLVRFWYRLDENKSIDENKLNLYVKTWRVYALLALSVFQEKQIGFIIDSV